MLPLNVDFEVALKSNYDAFQIKSSPYKNKIRQIYQLTRKKHTFGSSIQNSSLSSALIELLSNSQ